MSITAGLRLIRPVSKIAGTNLQAARAEAIFAALVHRNNESFIRSFHPSLEFFDKVWVFEDVDGQGVWLIPIGFQTRLTDTHAAGRPIHALPYFQKLPQTTLADSAMPVPVDLICRTINLRRMLTPNDLETARQTFPEAVGVRVLIAGWIVFLFRCDSDVKLCWRRPKPNSFGDRPIACAIVNHVPTTTAEDLLYGTVVARAPQLEMVPAGCLGLSIKLPNGENAITTATHCFVKLPTRSLMTKVIEKAYSSLWKIFSGPPQRTAPAVVRATTQRSY